MTTTGFDQSIAWMTALCVCGLWPGNALVAEEPPAMELQVISTGSTASCRGLAAVSDDCVWVGGSNGTLLVTRDAGTSWLPIDVPESDSLDFRDVEILPGGRIVVMSAGPQSQSRVLISDDNGASWSTTLQNEHPDGFFNGVDFCSATHGVLVGDPIDERFTVRRTIDGGQTWIPMEGPPAAAGEYGFAASGTGVRISADGQIALVSGGSRCRCHVGSPETNTWTTADIGIRSGSPGAGAFSLALRDDGTGLAIGGDYLAPEQSDNNVAVTRDGGQSWQLPLTPMPHKACVRAIGDSAFLTCGRTGIAVSTDGGTSWQSLSDESFYTLDVAPSPSDGTVADRSQAVIWLAGADGRVARMTVALNGTSAPTR